MTYATMALIAAFGVESVLAAFLLCRPLAKTWIPGMCGSTKDYVLANSIMNVSIDLLIIFLPMPLIWGLHMTTTRKIALTATFGLGFM